MAQKQRGRLLNDDQRRTIYSRWEALRDRSFRILALEERRYHDAIGLMDPARNRLRAADALHLAIVIANKCELATYDDDLAVAARAEGITVHG